MAEAHKITDTFSILSSAKEGIKALGERPLPLVFMAILVNLPPFLCTFFFLGSFLHNRTPGDLQSITLADLLNPTNICGLLVWFLGYVILRPIWINMCLNRCGEESSKLNMRTFISYGVATIIYLLIFSLCLALPTAVLSLFNWIVSCFPVSDTATRSINLVINLLQILLILAGTIAMIIALVRMVFFPYLIIHKQMGPIEALKGSYRLLTGIFWRAFGCGILFAILSWLLALIPGGPILTDILFGTTTAMIYVRRQEYLKA